MAATGPIGSPLYTTATLCRREPIRRDDQMPIYATPAGLMLFAHVPKCGGSGLEDVLTARFGADSVALLDRSHMRRKNRWSRTSPQHLEASALIRLMPRAMLALNVALVRHPATRLRSVYLHQRDIEGTIDADEDFGAWLDALPARREADPWYLDNHPRPMREMIPGGSKTFQLERDGVEAALAWIDAQTGGAGMPTGRRRHTFSARLRAAGRTAGSKPNLTAKRLALIREMYPRDYERFRYDTKPPRTDSAARSEAGLSPLRPARLPPG
ncbi:sulfotransferase family protein [Jannaschia sp.]|nr:sulfotransferase family protein [Jannaschia sp.]